MKTKNTYFDEMIEVVKTLEEDYNKFYNTIDNINFLIKNGRDIKDILALVTSDINIKEFTYVDEESGFYIINKIAFKNELSKRIRNYNKETNNFKFYKKEYKEIPYDEIYKLFKRELNGANIKWTDKQLDSDSYKVIRNTYDIFNKIYASEQYAVKKLQNINTVNDIHKMREAILKKFKTGDRYTRSTVRNYLQNIYNRYDYDRKAQFRDLNNFGIEFEEVYFLRKRAVQITRKLRKY